MRYVRNVVCMVWSMASMASMAVPPVSPAAIFDCSQKLNPLVFTSNPLKVVPNILGCTKPFDTTASLDQFRHLPVVFVHISKASGTTTESHLISWGRREYNYTSSASKSDTKVSSRSLPAFVADMPRPLSVNKVMRSWGGKGVYHKIPEKMFIGKNSVSVIDELPVERALLVTVLRDPATRILSQFLYSRHIDDVIGHFTASKLTFEQWYNTYRGRIPDISNFEVRLLLTRREAPEIFENVETGIIFDKLICRKGGPNCDGFRSKFPLPTITRPMLDRAKARIAGASLIGITERFSETMALWNYTLPGLWTSQQQENGDLKRCGNAGPTKEHCGDAQEAIKGIDRNVLAQIKQDNWASYELYDMAVELFEAQVASLKRRSNQ